MALPILYQDPDLVVVNKPAGLLVHRTLLDRNETKFALQQVRDQVGARVYPVHRLDRPTSGALVFAMSPENARTLSLAFADQRVEKSYLAVVRGVPPQKTLINYPLKEELDAICDSQANPLKAAQSAISEVERLASVELPIQVDRYPTSRYSLVRVIPKTGRKHQIRRHLRHLGHPIIGDVTHGVGKHNRFFAESYGNRRLLLACTEISFRHPMRDEVVRVKAPLCERFESLLRSLGWGEHVLA